MNLPTGPAGPYAFVFWNDHLDEQTVLRGVREAATAGFVGVTLSARVGLDRRVGYLTDEFLRLVRVAVDECARLGLAVMLYDEASYPSGSANGAVVATDPSLAARCLVPVVREIDGPVAEYWRPALGRNLDARLLAVVVRPAGDTGGARLLPVHAPGLVRLDLPDGRWLVTAVHEAASGGTTRGAHADQDDGSALAPPAADLLSPEAVDTFCAVTHDAYASVLGDHLGSTVVAVFTDEPFLLGRGHRPDARPYTRGLEDEVAERLGTTGDEVLRRLPELWDRTGGRPGGTDPAATGFARHWDDAVRDRLHRVYYGTLADWCERHGVALTGHPAEPDDLATTGRLHWPGQDTVWRWVLPGPTALTGPESTAPKVAASAARGRRAPAVAEVLGAYGWRLTLDEARWLLDWHLSRGVTTPVWHAFFASVRGGRAFESEPDLGVHNSWWPHLPPLVAYARRVGELLTASPPVWSVGVLTGDEAAAGHVVRTLLEHQVDFGYVGRDDVAGRRAYAVLVDPDDGVPDVETIRRRLRAAGAPVITCVPPVPDLRAVVLADGAGHAFFHEGEERVETTVHVPHVPDDARWWDPDTDTAEPVEVTDGGIRLVLDRRRTRVLTCGRGTAVAPPRTPRGDRVRLSAWRGSVDRVVGGLAPDDAGAATGSAPVLGPGDWSRLPALRRFAGSYRYVTEVDVPDGVHDGVLDLGVVGDVATVDVDGVTAGHSLAAPHRVTLRGLQPGRRRLEVLVSCSAANYYEGAELPAGLVGPVHLEL